MTEYSSNLILLFNEYYFQAPREMREGRMYHPDASPEATIGARFCGMLSLAHSSESSLATPTQSGA